MNCFLPKDYKYKHINDAGSKARWDIEQIMKDMGFRAIGKCHMVSKHRLLHFIRMLITTMRMPDRINKGDMLVLQYPIKYYETICRLAHWRGSRVVTFVHDLGCFRKKNRSVKKEMQRLNMSDDLIGCNPTICQWLRDNGFTGYKGKGCLEILQAFDFLSNSECTDRKGKCPSHQIAYAGQLARRKNSFLYKFGHHIEGYTVNVYGKGFDKSHAANPEKFNDKGFMEPDALIANIEGDFGLVWDGDAVDCCSGDWGEYLMVNTPHKVSLYMRCGLPIIIWRKAAMARFVEENGIGICVDSLREINGIYRRLAQVDYDRMCDNVARVSRMMSEGKFFSYAISRLMF